jgi:hypothetical protein
LAAWPKVFEAALAAQSRFWGGSGNLIFPQTPDFHTNPLFWRLADLFDADAFIQYAPTYGEVAEIAPNTHRKLMAGWRAELSKRSSTDQADHHLDEMQSEVAAEPRELTARQLDLIRLRLAPLHRDLGSGWHLSSFNSSDAAAWPLSEITDLNGLPDTVQIPHAPVGAARKLLLTATAGRVPRALAGQLSARGLSIETSEPQNRYEWAQVVRGHDRQRGKAVLPWELSDFGLARYLRGHFSDIPAALVVGDSSWDFALFYALHRLTGLAWWLPSWLAKDSVYLQNLEQAMLLGPRREGRRLVVVSASSPDTREKYAGQGVGLGAQRVQLTAADWSEVLPEEPLRFYERDNQGRTEMAALVDGATLELDTPLPKRVQTKVPTAMRWLTSAQGHDWAPVRHPSLGTRILTGGFSSTDLVRPTRDGAAYYALGAITLGGESLESSVIRPLLRPLSLLDQAQAILPDGWSCEPSDKGVWATEATKLFGGLEGLCKALRDPHIRAVTDVYLLDNEKGRLLSFDRRRYLSWSDLEEVVGSSAAREVLDGLLDIGVLRRGLVLKCARCRLAAWHSIASVSERFTCDRCQLEQSTDRFSWLGSDEPRWSYRLAEVLYQLLDKDGELPLLAVWDHLASSQRPVAQANELLITDPKGNQREIDIFASDGYRLWIGEATKSAKFKAGRLTFLRHLANATSAWGVLIATSQEKWSPATVEEATSLFRSNWPHLVMRAQVEVAPAKTDP